ncbi:MAG TPA: hypothetical protein VEF89_24400 [Solirubrobacteraceae bacterium]|nr:hypothetical protein [Solirubrobacteraceae bacterium]
MSSRARRILRRLREIATEIEYVQRRLLEIRTGVPFTPETERALARAEIARLETLYAHPHRDLELGCGPEPASHGDRILEPAARR